MNISLKEQQINSEIKGLKQQLLGNLTLEEGLRIINRISELRTELGMVQVIRAIA